MRELSFLLLCLLVASCGSGKKSVSDRTLSVAAAHKERLGKEVTLPGKTLPPKEERALVPKTETVADEIINTALTFSGVKYKLGGTTNKGMDCSGLLYVSFAEHNVDLPRSSANMAERGKRVKIDNVEKGDLLFFKTIKGAKRINHVGMVVSTDNDEIKFIHSSSSRGVIVSSLREGFWNYAFVKATRVL